MKPILEVKGISKKFKIQHERQPYLSLRDSFSNVFKKNKSDEEFWALKDVSFDIYPGDSVGIVGKNGAGKSTLLKILSKITPPSSGSIVSRGRIASLLEVGTGFHNELTGRENVYLNGSILGLKRVEINRQFDAIVDFSGIEKFLDTPLKHYSSGMQLRLAFAVAAHLEPEILIIDEVLAVGDVEFQKKCMGKMGEVSKSGRTILFVSHNMTAVKSLCKQGILLQKGQVTFSGSALSTVEQYNTSYQSFEKRNSILFKKEWQSKTYDIIIEKLVLKGSESGEELSYQNSENLLVKIYIRNNQTIAGLRINVYVYTTDEVLVMALTSQAAMPENLEVGSYEFDLTIPGQILNNGEYILALSVGIPGREVVVPEVELFKFEIVGNNSLSAYTSEKWPGIISPIVQWNVVKH